MRNKTLLYIGIAVFVLLLLAAVLLYAHYFGPVDVYAGQTNFIVQDGETTTQVTDLLKQEGFIRNRTIFELVLKSSLKGGEVRPGGYELSASMDVWSLAGALARPPYMVFFTFPPGWRKEQIADKLAETFNWTPAQKSEWLNIDTDPSPAYDEGVYYPDTYLIPSDQTPAQIAQRFISRFQDSFAPYADEARQEGMQWTDVLTMASLLEREAAGTQDMPLIAGILWNRIHAHMALQVDATLQYVAGNEANWWPMPTSADKFVSSPFNTYQHVGLPPHPIDEPSIAAIKAVLNPEKTDCLYYLHDQNGQIHCSKTYTGQLANVNKYLK
ncbi:MAG: endolytic transglycosylase MltG [Candidatus Pacebacteria bacterium]|nr:endolytic transglycosylase MltG [Candidatus Paceibacterota bacterium]